MLIVVDAKENRRKFTDMVKIPGMILMFLICVVGRYTANGMAAMIGDWIVMTVSAGFL